MISKLLILLVSTYLVSHVSSYVVTWTGDDEVAPSSKHLLGQKMCTRGPSYWCHNITHAKECHAIHHCIDKVWNDMTLPEDNDSVCQICKDMVQQARDQLLSNETQDELRQVLEGSCNLLPIKIVAKECRELADEFIPELVDTLASRMDPQVVCAVSGLCNSARIDKLLEDMNSTKKFDLSTDSCPKCNYYMGKSIQFLKGLPENDLLEKGMMLCGRLGSFSDSCSALLFAHMDDVYSHVQTKVNSEEFCGLVGLCEVTGIRRVSIGESSTSVRVWTPQDDDLPCDFCKQLVVHTKQWLVANTTKDEFRDLIRGICKQTGKFRKECLNLAQQYGKTLYQLLVDETDPDRVCGMIGVCTNTGKFQLFGKPLDGPLMTILPTHVQSVDTAPMLSLLPAERMAGNEEARINSPRLELIPAERIAGDDELDKKPLQNKEICEFCELALNQVQEYIQNDKTEKSIKDAVDKLCSRLPEELSDQCKNFLDNYSDSFIALLAQEIDPSVVCPKLGVCPGEADVQPVERERNLRVDRRPIGDLPTCPLCHMAVHKLIVILGQNKTKAAIDGALDSVCNLLPRHSQQSCLDLMNNYGNQIAEMIIMEGTAREICLLLHLCVWSQRPTSPTTPPKIIIESPLPFDRFMPATVLRGEIENLQRQHPGLNINKQNGKIKGGQQCVICEFAMEKLEAELKDRATEEEIKRKVEALCDHLPKSVSGQCNKFIEEYGELIIGYLASYEDPKQICVQLGLCDDNSISINSLDAQEELQKLEEIEDVSMGRCQLCTVLSDYLSAMLEDPKVETSIDRIVEKICPIMPSKYRTECKNMIEDYGPYLMSLVAQGTDKGKACAILSICPKTA